MSTVFTEFVRQMDEGPGGPDNELCEHLWQALRGVLAVEMKRRSAWQTRPSFLGIIGHRAWAEPGDSSDGLDELVSECFEHIFVVRLNSLRRQAKKKSSIDGLVLLGVRQFLLATQSRNDPLGFRVFEILQGAVQGAVAAGQLVVVQGGAKIRNSTHLALAARTSPEAVRDVDLSPLVQQWADRRLDALVNASHQRLAKLKEGLMLDVLDYLGPKRPGFRFGDLAAPLKEKVRREWAARFLNMPGFMAWRDEDTPVESAAEALVLRQYVAAVVRCLDRSEERDLDAKTRQYLSWLWGYLKGFAFEDLKRFVAGLVRRAGAPGDPDPDIFPTGRQLEALLGIPRARLPKLFERLRQQWQRCSERVGYPKQNLGTEGQAMATSSRGSKAFPDARARAMAALERALQTSAAGSEDGDAEASTMESTSLTAGDLFSVPWAEVDGVEWLVLQVDADGSTVRCCPTDQFPLTAASDLDLAFEVAEAEPRVVRLGLETALTVANLGPVEPHGRLSSQALEAVLGRRSGEGPLTADLVSELPTYREWLDDGPKRAQTLALAGRPGASGSAETVPTTTAPGLKPQPQPSHWLRWANAASLLLFVGLSVGLGWKVIDLGRQVAGLDAPIVDMPYQEIMIGGGVRGTTEVKVPEGARRLQLVFPLGELADYPEYRLDLVGATGELLFQTPPFTYAVEKSVTVSVRMLDEGPIEVRLIGLRDGQEFELDTETFVRAPTAGGFDP